MDGKQPRLEVLGGSLPAQGPELIECGLLDVYLQVQARAEGLETFEVVLVHETEDGTETFEDAIDAGAAAWTIKDLARFDWWCDDPGEVIRPGWSGRMYGVAP